MADLVLYDGRCGLCSRLNQFILARDATDHFRFASLQSLLAADLLRRLGRDAKDLDTVYVVANYGERGQHLLWKGRGVIHVLRSLGGVWGLARLLQLLPGAWVDALYSLVARHRYRWFGQSETCLLLSAQDQAKFLDGSPPAQ